MERDPPGDPTAGKRLRVDPMTITIRVALEQDMKSHIGTDDFYFDLVDFTKVKAFEVPGDTLVDHFKDTIIREFGIMVPFQLRMFRTRQNMTCRPDKILSPRDNVMPVTSLAVQSEGDVKLYVEVLNSVCPKNATATDQILVFLKFYDPRERYLRYVGALYVHIHSNPCEFVPMLKRFAGIDQEKEILLYEEIKVKPHVMCEQINADITFSCNELKDCDIICYQERKNTPGAYAYPYVTQFLQHMLDIKSLTTEIRTLQQENMALKARSDDCFLEIKSRTAECDRMNQIFTLNSQFILYFLESTLKHATNHYARENLVGYNEYGHVYKGVIDGTDVAIKISRSSDMFDHELSILRQCRQLPNVVKVLGRCSESLSYVYAWPSKGSLKDYIVGGSSGSSALKWYDRTRIICEICSVLVFLHSCQPPLLHGDLQLSNVLLDDGFRVMLTNIGMAKELLKTESSIPLAMASYLDPEFLSSLELTPSSDVFSLGILMLCLLTGKPPLNIVETVRAASENNSLQLLLDGSAVNWPLVKARQLASLAFRCVEVTRSNRPSIMEVSNEIEALTLNAEQKCTPPHFKCPINQVIMEDPQIAPDGYTYEKTTIMNWFDSPHNTPAPFGRSPVTNLNLPSNHLVDNVSLRSAIKVFQETWRLWGGRSLQLNYFDLCEVLDRAGIAYVY